MASSPQRTAGLVFLLAALLSVVAAVYPAARGRPVHAVFGVLALVWLVIGVAQLRRGRG